MTSWERVRLLPGRLCIGFLNEGRQGKEEGEQCCQKQEPAESLSQTTASLQVGLHGDGWVGTLGKLLHILGLWCRQQGGDVLPGILA